VTDKPPLVKIGLHQVDSPRDWETGAAIQREEDIRWFNHWLEEKEAMCLVFRDMHGIPHGMYEPLRLEVKE
jgi:hypothetical protein